MKKTGLKKLIVLLITAGIGSCAYADTSANLVLQTSVPAAIAVVKSDSGTETGSIDPRNGSHSGLNSVFNIQTNGDDTNFDIILSSSVNASGSSYPAFNQDGSSIVFTHATSVVTKEDVDNAKNGTASKNAIAYPLTVDVTSPMETTFKASLRNYEDCYQVLLNDLKEGSVTCIVGGTPVGSSYNVGLDESGTYQATVTLTAVGK